MKIVIICSVRSGTPQGVYDYVSKLENEGHKVYFPLVKGKGIKGIGLLTKSYGGEVDEHL